MKKLFGVCAFLLLLVLSVSASAADSPGAFADHEAIAYKISRGHAYNKHVCFPDETPDMRGNRCFPHMTRDEFKALVLNVLDNPDDRKRLRGPRRAYWKDDIVVIVNLRAKDRGTSFKPRNGKTYFNNLR